MSPPRAKRGAVVICGDMGDHLDATLRRWFGPVDASADTSSSASTGRTLDEDVTAAGAAAAVGAAAAAEQQPLTVASHPYFSALANPSVTDVEAPAAPATLDGSFLHVSWRAHSGHPRRHDVPLIFTFNQPPSSACFVRLVFMGDAAMSVLGDADLADVAGYAPSSTYHDSNRAFFEEIDREFKAIDRARSLRDKAGIIEVSPDAAKLNSRVVTFWGDVDALRRVLADLSALQSSPDDAFAWGLNPRTVRSMLHHVYVGLPAPRASARSFARDLVYLPKQATDEAYNRADTVLRMYFPEVLFVVARDGVASFDNRWVYSWLAPMVSARDQRLEHLVYVDTYAGDGDQPLNADHAAVTKENADYALRDVLSHAEHDVGLAFKYKAVYLENAFWAAQPELSAKLAEMLAWSPELRPRALRALPPSSSSSSSSLATTVAWGARLGDKLVTFRNMFGGVSLPERERAKEFDVAIQEKRVLKFLNIAPVFASGEEATRVYYSREFAAKVDALLSELFPAVEGYDYARAKVLRSERWSANKETSARARAEYDAMDPPRTWEKTKELFSTFLERLTEYLVALPPFNDSDDAGRRAGDGAEGPLPLAKRARTEDVDVD